MTLAWRGDVQRIETPAGLVTGRRISEAQYRIRLNTPGVVALDRPADGVCCAYLELGDPGIPHAVLETDLDRPREELRTLARRLRWDGAFPRGANVNLCMIAGENRVRLLTFERGVEDFTLACGTGTGATVAALTLLGRVSGQNTLVQCDGGVLYVDAALENGKIAALFLTGDATFVYRGELPGIKNVEKRLTRRELLPRQPFLSQGPGLLILIVDILEDDAVFLP